MTISTGIRNLHAYCRGAAVDDLAAAMSVVKIRSFAKRHSDESAAPSDSVPSESTHLDL